jgi:hypothetical protein
LDREFLTANQKGWRDMNREQLIKEISDLVKCDCSPDCKMLDTDKDYPSIIADFILSHTEELKSVMADNVNRLELNISELEKENDRLKALVDTSNDLLGSWLLAPAREHVPQSVVTAMTDLYNRTISYRAKIAEFKEGK